MRKFSLKKKIVSAALAAIMAISMIPALPSSLKEVQATGTTQVLSKNLLDTDYAKVHDNNQGASGSRLIRVFNDGKNNNPDASTPIFTADDVMVYEMDAECTTGKNSSRIGFTFVRTANAHICVQGDEVYYGKTSELQKTDFKTDKAWTTGADWHLKFVIKLNDYIQMIITDNANNDAEICNVTLSKSTYADWANMSLYENNQTYGPNFFAYDTTCTLSNFYVGYDLTAEVAALESAIATADTRAAELTNPSATVTSTIASAKTTLATAKAGNALKSDVTSAITTLSELVYEEAAPSAIYSKNLLDTTYAKVHDNAVTSGSRLVRVFKDGNGNNEEASTPIFTEDDLMVYEMDAACTTGSSANSSRIGFTFVRTANAHICVQGNQIYYGKSSSLQVTDLTTTKEWKTGADWHLKFVVKLNDSIRMIITDNADNNAEICDVTLSKSTYADWANMSLYQNGQTYGPNFYAYNTTCTLSNFYVGYDLTAEVTALETAIATAETRAAELTNPSATVTSTIASAKTTLETAKAGNALKSDVTTAITALSELVYEEAVPSAIYSKNLLDTTYAIVHDNEQGATGSRLIRVFKDGQGNNADASTPIFTADDVMVYEMDAECTTGKDSSRIGFTFVRQASAHIFVQGNTVYYRNSSGNQVSTQYTTTAQWKTGADWHLKFVVKLNDYIQMIITDNANNGAQICDVTISKTEFSNLATMSLYENNQTYGPNFFAYDTACTLSDFYVGYDLTAEVAALETAIATAETEAGMLTNPSATVTSTIASAKTTLETAKAGNALKTDVTSAITALSSLVYENASASLTVGDGTTVSTVSISIAVGETLPTGWNEDKYIIDWTYNGEKVTTYAADTDVSKYVPNFIDKKMLVVKTQTKTEANNTVTARFIGSLDNYKDTDYDYVGFVLSTTTADPLQATNHLDKDIHVVWDAIYASGNLKTAASIYDSYSNYLFALDVEGLTVGKTVYARAYIKLTNGEIVYGDPCTIGIQN